MRESEPNDFASRFRRRQRMFLEAVRHAIQSDASWQVYLDVETVHEDGRIDCRAVSQGNPSDDSETLLRYCRQISDQGFTVEVAVDESGNLHVVSWEGREPTWPAELSPVYSVRWHSVADLPVIADTGK